MADRDFPAAESALTRGLQLRSEIPRPGRVAELQAELALLAFNQGDLALACERIAPLTEVLGSLDGTDEPERIRGIVERIQSQPWR